jgi:hypothetical protein
MRDRLNIGRWQKGVPVDLVYVGVTVAFFALSWGLVRLCVAVGGR